MDVLDQAQERLEDFNSKISVIDYQITEKNAELEKLEDFIISSTKRLELMKLATLILQELVDVVSTKNIIKIESLVNSALVSVFYDENYVFKIKKKPERNQHIYKIVLCKNGIEGNENSFGGGVWSWIAFVLKILFNILSKRFPLLVPDESLSFLSAKYIPNASSFINDLSQEFNLPILLVTHQPLFADSANIKYELINKGTHSEIVDVTDKDEKPTFQPDPSQI